VLTFSSDLGAATIPDTPSSAEAGQRAGLRSSPASSRFATKPLPRNGSRLSGIGGGKVATTAPPEVALLPCMH
jgi:hypothetical protein